MNPQDKEQFMADPYVRRTIESGDPILIESLVRLAWTFGVFEGLYGSPADDGQWVDIRPRDK